MTDHTAAKAARKRSPENHATHPRREALNPL